MNEKFNLCVDSLCDGIEDDKAKEKVRLAFKNALIDACYNSARAVAPFTGADYLQVAQRLCNLLIY